MGRGCQFCNCSDEPTAHACEGCYKLHTTDWLEEFPDILPDDIFEVRFKNTRKSYFKNVNSLPLKRGDVVAVEASPGHDIGIISMTGDMVARQMKRVGFNPQNGEFKKIYRKAKPYDIEKWQEAIAMEHMTMIRSRQIASDLNLNMKIGDVEYQGDKIKAIFYYIADERVDFRELIKVFAEQFKVRVEMKQIGARQEAGRIGGLGSCGRELCCASWISSFVSVTTNAARHQEISLNPQKLAGQCSKLKCCLVYELDTYLDARKELPRINQPLQALDGEYFLVKTDILGRTMSFSTTPHAMVGVITLSLERVREILEINKRGKKVDRLIDMSLEVEKPVEIGFVNVIGEESINRFDKKREGGKAEGKGDGLGRRNRNNRGKGDNRNGGRSENGGENRGNSANAGSDNRGETRGENRGNGRNQRPDNKQGQGKQTDSRSNPPKQSQNGGASGSQKGVTVEQGEKTPSEKPQNDGANGAQNQNGGGSSQRPPYPKRRKKPSGNRSSENAPSEGKQSDNKPSDNKPKQ